MGAIRMRVREPAAVEEPPPEELATAVTTGAMLNEAQSVSSYDDRSFYISYTGADLDEAADWELTYSHAQNAGKGYEGELASVRWANATWAQNDDGVVENPGDVTEAEADANTAHFVSWLPAYRANGVKAVSVGFECGNPINNEDDPALDPATAGGLTYHISGGSPSAFGAGGTTLKAAHLARMESLIEAAGAQGMAVILQFFYARQCRWLSTTAAYEAGIDTAVAWLKSKGYRNVLLDLANESGDDPSGNWATGHADIWKTDAGAAQMAAYYKTSWGAAPNRPAMGISSRTIPGPLTNAETDIVWCHTNVMATGSIDTELGSLQALAQPVAVNETDRHPDEADLTNRALWLSDELDTWDDIRAEDASIGLMFSTSMQRMHVSREHAGGGRWPFMPDIGDDDDVTVGDAQVALRNMTRAWMDAHLALSGGLPDPEDLL